MNDGDYLRLKYGWEAGQIQIVLPPAGLRDAQVGVFPFTAAGRQIIQGLPDPVLTDYELRAETAMVQALQQVMDTIADRIGQVQTAAGRQVWDGCLYGFHPRHDGPCVLVAHLPGKHSQKDHARKGKTPGAGGVAKTGRRQGFAKDSDVRSAYNYTDQKSGLRAKVVGIDRDSNPGEIEVEVSIRDKTGAEVGTAWRLVHEPTGDGEPGYVVHDSMALAPGTQGTGFGSRFNSHAEGVYREQGMDRIELAANVDVGGYAWARAGYDFDPRADVHGGLKVQERFDAAMRNEKFAPHRATVAALSARTGGSNPPTPAEWAMVGHTPGATMWAGKEIMLGSSWAGVKKL